MAIAPTCSFLVDDPTAWIVPDVKKLAHDLRAVVFHRTEDLGRGDFCFLLGCTKIVPPEVLKRHSRNLVVHESALPKGRGWSPVQWQILEGKNSIPVTMFEATEECDAGPVWLRDMIELDGAELLPEIRRKQWETTERMVRRFLAEYTGLKPESQCGDPSSYRRRGPEDDRLDPNATLAAQFDRLRIANNDQYPAWFEHRGRHFKIKIDPI